MPKRSPKPLKPTKRQREIMAKFKAGMDIYSMWMFKKCPPGWDCEDIENAIRACLRWGGGRG